MKRPGRWWVAAAALAGVAATARLGVWQLDRADQKLALQARISARGALPPLPGDSLARTPGEADAQLYRQVQLRGRWLADHTLFLDNRQMGGRPGFFVVTPLQMRSGDAVLVQRGWVPRNFVQRDALPVLATPGGEVDIIGRVAPPPSKLFDFGGADTGRIRQNLDLATFSGEIGLVLRPLSVQQLDAPRSATPPDTPTPTAEVAVGQPAPPTSNPDLQRQWPAPAVDVGKHQGYAFQWFALCALITGLYVWFQIIQPRRR